ncbi:MAG: transcription termination factor Rho, partial [Myxococcota bacterium]
DMALERAKRLVEQGRDVVLLVDSMTRLTRAILTSEERSAPDPMAAYRARRYFATGRQLEEGGSLTIIATALRGSSADISDELLDAANVVVDLVAQPWLDDMPDGVPGLHLARSFARQQERYLSQEDRERVRSLRRALSGDARADLTAALSQLHHEADDGPE